MFADACELATLQSAGIEMCDVVIAAAGDDKVNLVFAMLCKSEFSVARVVARINNPDNRWMFTEAWGVDVAVSTPSAVVSAVEEQVSSGKVVRLVDLQQQGRTSIVEITVPADSAAGGTPIGRLELPSGAALLAVLRGRDVLTGAPDEPLLPGDEVVLVAAVEVEEQLRAVFAPVPSQAAAD
jgi:trk system potassium uptake protein TrkA